MIVSTIFHIITALLVLHWQGDAKGCGGKVFFPFSGGCCSLAFDSKFPCSNFAVGNFVCKKKKGISEAFLLRKVYQLLVQKVIYYVSS